MRTITLAIFAIAGSLFLVSLIYSHNAFADSSGDPGKVILSAPNIPSFYADNGGVVYAYVQNDPDLKSNTPFSIVKVQGEQVTELAKVSGIGFFQGLLNNELYYIHRPVPESPDDTAFRINTESGQVEELTQKISSDVLESGTFNDKYLYYISRESNSISRIDLENFDNQKVFQGKPNNWLGVPGGSGIIGFSNGYCYFWYGGWDDQDNRIIVIARVNPSTGENTIVKSIPQPYDFRSMFYLNGQYLYQHGCGNGVVLCRLGTNGGDHDLFYKAPTLTKSDEMGNSLKLEKNLGYLRIDGNYGYSQYWYETIDGGMLFDENTKTLKAYSAAGPYYSGEPNQFIRINLTDFSVEDLFSLKNFDINWDSFQVKDGVAYVWRCADTNTGCVTWRIEKPGGEVLRAIPVGASASPLLASEAAMKIPSWIKSNAKWWSEGSLTDDDFIKGVQYMIQQGIMKIPQTQSSSGSSQQIPTWIKNNAGRWANGQISDDEFVKGIQYLVQQGIIAIKS